MGVRADGGGGDRVIWAWVGWRTPAYRKQCPARLARACRGDHRARAMGQLGALATPLPVLQPLRSACSWWATFSSSASMADRLSSSWS